MPVLLYPFAVTYKLTVLYKKLNEQIDFVKSALTIKY